ncbi:prevent-host-death protein [Enterococcus sp. JM4C]|uniref:type II toxin-antitoxin system prevent-host-death family antitoxin n=1 Tax=Candidatus Enterococcus huntleyi TaxID=1857217 RepID=UPI00137B07BE|nr:type II toxin-antitoxin system prevent-host-death family antitoxin [Enterococcus sp. JM4C]KAF1295684.1 prevent-host-death protein [Enterococcus sp. JM4C]
MKNIKPISDLRNYNRLLTEVTNQEPVYLTKNGRVQYAVLEITYLEKLQAAIDILDRIKKEETSNEGSITNKKR